MNTYELVRNSMRDCGGNEIKDDDYTFTVFIKDDRWNAYKGPVNSVAKFVAEHLDDIEYYFINNICELENSNDRALSGWLKKVKGKDALKR